MYSAAEDMRGKTNTIQLAMNDGARHVGSANPDYVCVGDGKAEEKCACAIIDWCVERVFEGLPVSCTSDLSRCGVGKTFERQFNEDTTQSGL